MRHFVYVCNILLVYPCFHKKSDFSSRVVSDSLCNHTPENTLAVSIHLHVYSHLHMYVHTVKSAVINTEVQKSMKEMILFALRFQGHMIL